MSKEGVQVFVITLRRSLERHSYVERELKAQGVDFDFFYGVDASLEDHPLLKKIDQVQFLKNHGRQVVKGEVGCYSSHYLMWQKCIALNKPIIVLEDDFSLSDNAAVLFKNALDLSDKYGYIRLERDKKTKPSILLQRSTEFRVVRFLKIPQSLKCYLITPAVARSFCEKSERFVLPVDYFIRHQHNHGQPIYGMIPAPVLGGNMALESGIGSRHNQKTPLKFKITRHFFRLKNFVLNSYTNLKFLGKDFKMRKALDF
ncbi:glycosyltransferase family 25 protein [Thiomicrospira microaerophila]|uniref:glycosyltransferase family 25 protein n=1 Tax=Thiomicrospira microaerophila TaxID=406020 RepID=UPI00200F0EFC|nr:glycosyltransferase family 25 protein [Thiomicrospira microaerophila]UQB42434.1 glycosyltransferase family 25 protein [Thiomicrospira microaerophila]